MRRTPLAVLAAVALAGCGSSGQTSGTRASGTASTRTANSVTVGRAPATAACGRVSVAYAATQGATGHLELTFAARNASDHPCRLKGYPRARLLDAAGRTLGMKIQNGHGFFPDTLRPPRTVTLRPGQQAQFALSFVTNNEFQGARTCRRATVAMTALPGSNWTPISLKRAPKVMPCGRQLVVSPIYA